MTLRRLGLSALLFLVGCTAPAGGTTEPAPGGASAAFGLTVDGQVVFCARPSVLEVEARANVEIDADEGAEVSATLDGAEVALEGAPLREGALAVEGRAVLEVRVTAGAAERSCTVTLARRDAVRAGLATLEASSEGRVRVARSARTGAPADAVLNVPTTGATPRERADGFLAAQAAAFAVEPAQLTYADTIFSSSVSSDGVSSDGWASVVYTQRVDAVRALGASFTVDLDAEGRVRGAHAQTYPDLTGAPPFLHDVGQILALAPSTGVGAPAEAERVIYDPVAPKAGWWLVGPHGAALVDDAMGEVLGELPAAVPVVNVELHQGASADPLAPMPTLSHVGPSDGAPRHVGPAMASAADLVYWQHMADVANYTEHTLRYRGWNSAEVRVVMIPDNIAAWATRGYVLMGYGLRDDVDVYCHEHSHMIRNAMGAGSSPTINEALADAFAIFCEGRLDPGRNPYVIGDSVRIRNLRTGGSISGQAGLLDYDQFLAAGVPETALDYSEGRSPYPATFVLTHALYRMLEAHGLDEAKAERITFEAHRWRSAVDYPTLRDRWLSTAQSWADAGHHGFTQDDVCAMARGFRDTKLDGEYGVGAGCTVSAPDFVCTHASCEVCGEAVEISPVCSEASLRGPTCESADGRSTCVGSVATSAEGCMPGAGQVMGRACSCVSDGAGGARWDCSTAAECRPVERVAGYCGEAGRADQVATSAPPATPRCSVRPGADGRAPALLLLAALLVALGRRRAR